MIVFPLRLGKDSVKKSSYFQREAKTVSHLGSIDIDESDSKVCKKKSALSRTFTASLHYAV